MKSKLILLVLSIIFTSFSIIKADDGYRLWLKYDLVTDTEYLRECRKAISGIDLPADSPTLVAARAELMAGLTGLTGIHIHPLFGAMPETPLMMEFQITQEYLGCSTHLVFLAPLFEECLKSDTYCKGPGSYIAKVIDGSLGNSNLTGIAGVSNIGTERNWSGHLFGQANWFAFGRLAWNPYFASEDIAKEWVRMTFSGETDIVSLITVRWDFRMESGRTLWDELCFKYHEGVDGTNLLLNEWDKLNGRIDPEQFDHVRSLLSIQVNEARWWRDACILYFQTFSKRPIPAGLEKPQNTLEYYMKLKFSYVPGI